MARPRATYLYTETRLNLDPAYSGSTVELDLTDGTNFSLPKRKVLSEARPSISEATFSKNHLASDSSVYFRREARYPRSFLWRLLDDRKLLELQSVDLTQDASEKSEALLTINIKFKHAIRPYGIAFADPDEKDALVIFAITKSGELFTITLHKDVFIHLKATETLPIDWCKVFFPPAMRVREPYRLISVNANELFVALSDGGLLKLERKSGNDGASWRETYFTAPGWNLPRALAKWKGDSYVQYGNSDLDAFSAASVAMSPEGDNIITVCLNHTMRIWDASNGKITLQTDLTELDESRLHSQPKFLISPTQRQLLQVVDVPGREGDQYFIVTFSPKQHQFTFWAVLDAESGLEGVRPVQTDFSFVPPIDDLMETSAWTLEEFYITANRGWSETHLWLRARSGPISRVFTVEFSLFGDEEELESSWATGWCAVNVGRQSPDHLNLEIPPDLQTGDQNLHCPGTTDRWLGFLFYPGRFTTATLETALHVYFKGSTKDDKPVLLSKEDSLQQRISSVVSKRASFAQIGIDHDKREIKTSEEWLIFYGLVQDLHKRRSTTTSFILDTEDRLPWIVSADFVSPIRTSKDLDICDFHRSAEHSVPSEDEIAKRLDSPYETLDLLHVAHTFRSSLPSTFNDTFKRALLPELLNDPAASVGDRIQALQVQAAFNIYIGDEDWDRLSGALDDVGGYDVLDYEGFSNVFEQMDQQQSGRQNTEQITRYGARAVIRTAQENMALHTNTLLDLLLLVVYVETEIEVEDLESGMQDPTGWRGQDAYVELLDKLREQVVLEFLMSNLRTEQTKHPQRSSMSGSPTSRRMSTSDSVPAPTYTSTLMESMFIGDWSSINVPSDLELPGLITYWARSWTSGLDLATQFDNFTAHVLSDLIKHNDVALSTAFVPYVSNTAWSTYLRGRHQLAIGDYDMAAISFQKAAYSLSLTDVLILDTAQLLRPDERSQFANGIVGYYEHIMDLFDHLKSFSHVVDFAQAALQHQYLAPPPAPEKKSSKKSSIINVPPSSQANILSRLFTASLDSAQFDIAYSALTRLPNAALRKSSLQQFIDALVRLRQPARILSYPFAALASELDSELAQKARTALSVTSPNSVGFHRVLYALRIKRGDFRGAAQCLWEYIIRLKATGESTFDPRDDRLAEAYLMVINAMCCCGTDEAWVLDDGLAAGESRASVKVRFAVRVSGVSDAQVKKRKVVFLEDVRKEYQDLLDRQSALEEGKYAFVGDDMEVDVL